MNKEDILSTFKKAFSEAQDDDQRREILLALLNQPGYGTEYFYVQLDSISKLDFVSFLSIKDQFHCLTAN